MKYIKCPVCEVNPMFETEDMCDLCYADSNPSARIVRRQKSTFITIDQFFAGENQQVVRLAKKLLEEIEKLHPHTESYAISGTGGNKGYLALKKGPRNFVVFELRENHLRVNLFCPPDETRRFSIPMQPRVTDNSSAFNVDKESQLEEALKMIEWGYENRQCN